MTNDDLFDFPELVRLLRNNRHPNGLKAQAAATITILTEQTTKLRAELEAYKKYGFEPCDYANMRAIADREKQCRNDLSALMERCEQVCANLEQVSEELEKEKEYTAFYQGLVDKYETEIMQGFRRQIERAKQERDAAVADIEEILRTAHDTDICQYCDRTKHCADYGCEVSAKWRGPQKTKEVS